MSSPERAAGRNLLNRTRLITAGAFAFTGTWIAGANVAFEGIGEKDYAQTAQAVTFGLALDGIATGLYFSKQSMQIGDRSLVILATAAAPAFDRIANTLKKWLPDEETKSETNKGTSFSEDMNRNDFTINYDPNDSPVDNLQSTPPMVKLQESENFYLFQPELHR